MPDSTSTDKPARKPKRSFRPQTLAGTRGPDPATPVEEVQLAIGAIVGTHALDGELRVKLTTDYPEQLLDIDEVLVGEKRVPFHIQSVRFHKGMALIRFEEIEGIDAGEALRGATIRISGRHVQPLAENEYFLYQVVGLAVREESGTVIGTVTDVLETGANMVIVVTPDGGGADELFPSIPEVVIELEPTQGYMVVRRQEYWE